MRHIIATLLLASILGVTTTATLATESSSTIPVKKQTQLGLYLSAQEAFEMKNAGGGSVLFVDIRTPEEYEYVGHASAADLNIPSMKTDYSGWDNSKSVYRMVSNSHFQAAMEEALKARQLDKNAAIILMCRSGDRSAIAANLLAKAGYTRVYSVHDGFEGDMAPSGDNRGKRTVNGWKNAGLPWEYTMEKSKAYWEYTAEKSKD